MVFLLLTQPHLVNTNRKLLLRLRIGPHDLNDDLVLALLQVNRPQIHRLGRDGRPVIEVNRLCREVGIGPMAYFIIGLPGETRQQIDNTINFIHRLKLDATAVFIYNPLPGSELFEECLRRGYITEKSFFETGNQYFSSVIDSEEWTSRELEAIIRTEYLRCYLAVFYNPWPFIRRYLLYFRYRPGFLRFFGRRTWRTIKLRGELPV